MLFEYAAELALPLSIYIELRSIEEINSPVERVLHNLGVALLLLLRVVEHVVTKANARHLEA